MESVLEVEKEIAALRARVAWLETELARVAAKADAAIKWEDERDKPTPKPGAAN